MYNRILLPTDGSETADRAVEEAIDAAKKYDAAFHALYVVDQTAPVLNVRGSDASLDRLEAEGEEVVDETIERADQAAVASVTGSVRRGEPAQTILDYIDTHDIDLVVMGTHGRSGLDRHLLGSVAEKVVRHSDTSVLMVRRTDSERK
ncbi:universal stress protein [Haladaptatus halobius]|uniref:universal stress protein n=1 Tax=Haladaptatus halobius TaxID=2884875 RepID=UPI001D0A7AA2|nr:universal stress protein [Haladaptatus halobius]